MSIGWYYVLKFLSACFKHWVCHILVSFKVVWMCLCCHDNLSTLRLHSQELQAQVTKLTNQLSDTEQLLANRTAELQAHLQTTSVMTVGSGDAKLQAQVNTLLLEKVGVS